MNLLTHLANDNGVLGLLLALAITAIVYLYKAMITEKDKEIKIEKDVVEEITIVLKAIDNTQKAILIDLEKK